MKSESLTKILSLLIKLEWGVDILDVDAPFILTKSKKGEEIRIGCNAVEHTGGLIPQCAYLREPDYLMILITNKSGNNTIMLNKAGTQRLLKGSVHMKELVPYILYKNETEINEINTPV